MEIPPLIGQNESVSGLAGSAKSRLAEILKTPFRCNKILNSSLNYVNQNDSCGGAFFFLFVNCECSNAGSFYVFDAFLMRNLSVCAFPSVTGSHAISVSLSRLLSLIMRSIKAT